MDTRPNLFVIGAPRCGTTSLYSSLKQHPDVYTSVLKEPHFHARDLPVQPHAVPDPADYARLFALAGGRRWRAEASVWYLYSAEAPIRIAHAHPDARVVVLLRHPVTMAVSLYGLYRRTGNEGEADADAALMRAGETAFPASYFPFGLHYRRLLDYATPLRHWLSHVDPQRIRVMFYEEHYADQQAGFTDLCDWLQIDRDVTIAFDPAEAKRRVHAEAMRQLRDLPAHLRGRMKPGIDKIHSGRNEARVSAATLQVLHAEAMAANAPLAGLLGRALPEAWARPPLPHGERRAPTAAQAAEAAEAASP